ncbi:2-succinyl-6-hydroxy-2,4-cyclohexadiene-1-carboxylate synthase [Vibrio ostreicida]|uniref:Putative 2-succinyl-6-hydroxy-2,4-cyclohexadiene-1-carboxylate synthase n=1 Tax=Vibrio ostreicida TaxID=526588 RepID=A0ABT8BVQ0_9VIBR|nr:2-succinyl-6-hydroxy-2,4-cyclohexadiene-1-carboxylate synthase [Vibrio ostreicida]MDN3610469.1 2-succinyl-6-hydroxy-2,4-cyclohexadiene-1-carboxylate synthase [Vibrio ostreicida]NPD07528.1 2-succinyl-6-hydroxy-2,4-cyclohexadiene-1-carboxylate synthase [Vibrio ostreicida]
MLFSLCYHPDQAPRPLIVFLHGFLGSGEDWTLCLNTLRDYPIVCIDLPGHGHSQSIHCADFKTCCDNITATVSNQFPHQPPIMLVGYSLGARVAMTGVAQGYFSALNIRGLILEGGHFGLSNHTDKRIRLCSDAQWAKRFSNEPMEHVLADWYQQPVFDSLNDQQRQSLIRERAVNVGDGVASMLMATTLAKQEALLDWLVGTDLLVHCICGEKDRKFRHLIEQGGLAFSRVRHAGHNVHREQPQAFANIIQSQLLRLF